VGDRVKRIGTSNPTNFSRGSVKEPVDNAEFYEHSEFPRRDKIYNAIVARYGKKGNRWSKSDTFVWKGFIYHIWDYFWMVVFIYIIYWAANALYDHYGMWRAISFIFVVILIRINMLIRVQKKMDRTLHSKSFIYDNDIFKVW
jgi:hypothetical protein